MHTPSHLRRVATAALPIAFSLNGTVCSAG